MFASDIRSDILIRYSIMTIFLAADAVLLEYYVFDKSDVVLRVMDDAMHAYQVQVYQDGVRL